MGRVRRKGKKSVASHDDPGSGEEEKIPAQKRRGRPQKPLKDEIDENDIGKVEKDNSENKDLSIPTIVENNKRKRNSPTKEKQSPVKEEHVGATLVSDISTKPNGFRHIGSRRKNKPRRAAEVGVEYSYILSGVIS